MKCSKMNLPATIWPKRVGFKYGGKIIHYKDIYKNKNEWIDPQKFLPEEYDMVELQREGKDPIKGWSSALSWDGLKLKNNDKILAWRCLPEEKNAIEER